MVLALLRVDFGDVHPLMLMTVANLAVALRELGGWYANCGRRGDLRGGRWPRYRRLSR